MLSSSDALSPAAAQGELFLLSRKYQKRANNSHQHGRQTQIDYALTAREAEILEKMAEGPSDNEIADALFISRNTVRFHVSNVLRKRGAGTRVEAVRKLTKSQSDSPSKKRVTRQQA